MNIKMRLINEEEFRYDSLTDEEKKYIFNLFKDSYLKSVGTYWSEEKFIKKTKDWLFFGDKINGFIAAKENNGIFKLIISAGSLGSVINGINELLSLNKPVWGLSNDKLKNFLNGRAIMLQFTSMISPLQRSVASFHDLENWQSCV
jgi:hypothetical protein